jgi:hypothetical protein
MGREETYNIQVENYRFNFSISNKIFGVGSKYVGRVGKLETHIYSILALHK